MCMICTIILPTGVTGCRIGFHKAYDLCGSRVLSTDYMSLNPGERNKKNDAAHPATDRYSYLLWHTATYQINIQIMFNRFGYECHQTLSMLSTATLMR